MLLQRESLLRKDAIVIDLSRLDFSSQDTSIGVGLDGADNSRGGCGSIFCPQLRAGGGCGRIRVTSIPMGRNGSIHKQRFQPNRHHFNKKMNMCSWSAAVTPILVSTVSLPREPRVDHTPTTLTKSTSMRYGPNLHELDPAIRRKSTQSLKKAAPGAPFGWSKSGAPYIGTQYAVRGAQFASVSTRNGGASYYWKSLKTVSKKVALSAIETHGAVDNLLAGESMTAPCSEIMTPEELATVRATFTRLIGEEELHRLESAGSGFSVTDGVKPEPESKAKVDSQAETPDAPVNGAEKSEATEASCVGAKRKARMALVDDMAATRSPANDAKPARLSKSRCVD